jgi:hypothetical protein
MQFSEGANTNYVQLHKLNEFLPNAEQKKRKKKQKKSAWYEHAEFFSEGFHDST